MNKITEYGFYVNSLTIYAGLRRSPLLIKLDELVLNLSMKEPSVFPCVNNYCDICSALFQESKGKSGNISAHIMELVKRDDNFFSRACAKGKIGTLDISIMNAIKHDLTALYKLSQLTSAGLKEILSNQFPDSADLIASLPEFSNEKSTFNWANSVSYFEYHYKQNATGIFSKHLAFSYDGASGITPITDHDPITFHELKHYEHQHNRVKENTLGFIEGKPYNNVLLYGDRGTGKSSTVKALLNEYHTKGLRIIGVAKQDLVTLDKLIAMIADIPLKFIVFIDDLTFTENDESFGVLKAILEGSLVKRPENLAIYATTNRRHLIKETFTAREGDEIHKADTIDENLSLSDRFGLIVTYSHPTKDKYLDIVRQLADDRGLTVDEKILFMGAERFALEKSGRTPRLAKQYVDHIEARVSLNLPL